MVNQAESESLLSVIMTVFNGEEFLREALDGIFLQTYKNFELIVVNNCSTDGTQSILDGAGDTRLRVVQAESHGTFGDGIRLAYSHARGDFIAVNDADDVSQVDRFEKQVAVLKADPTVGLVSSYFREIDVQGRLRTIRHPPKDERLLKNLFPSQNPLAHSTYMYRRAAADVIGGYPPEYQYGADFGMVIRMAKAGWKLRILSEPLANIRIHDGQASRAKSLSGTRAHDAMSLYSEALELDGLSSFSRRKGRDAVAMCRLMLGISRVRNASIMVGMIDIIAGFFARPALVVSYAVYFLRRRVSGGARVTPPIIIHELVDEREHQQLESEYLK